MNWNTIAGIAATVSLFLPVAVILYYKLFEHRSLAALMASYLLTGIYNLMSNQWIVVPAAFLRNFGIANNLLDIPLILLSLLFFCPIKSKQKTVYFILGGYIFYEIIAALLIGFNRDLIVYVQGPGILVVLAYAFYLFVRHIRITVEYSKNAGRTLMLASILFGYVCYGIIYFFYYIQRTPNVEDAYLIYFISTFISSIVMTVGLQLVRKRLKELQEVKNTRKELAVFFNT
jgi:hypothetical protein